MGLFIGMAPGLTGQSKAVTPLNLNLSPATVVEWWPTASDFNAMLGTNQADSTELIYEDNATLTPGIPDPDGGTGAFQITESTDGGTPTYHYVAPGISNGIVSYRDVLVHYDPEPGGRNTLLIFGDNLGRFLNFSTGVDSQYDVDTTTDAEWLGDGWFLVRFRTPAVDLTDLRFYPCTDALDYVYDGDGRLCGTIYLPSNSEYIYGVNQTRLESIAGKLNGYNLTNGTPSLDPLVGTWVANSNGRPGYIQEVGRSAQISSTNATILSTIDGTAVDRCTYSIFGVAAMTATGCRLFYNHAASGSVDQLYRSGDDMVYYRLKGGGSIITYTFVGAGAAWATPKTFLFLGLPNGTVYLNVGGTSYGSGSVINATDACIDFNFLSFSTATTAAIYDTTLVNTQAWTDTATNFSTAVEPWLRRLRKIYNVS